MSSEATTPATEFGTFVDEVERAVKAYLADPNRYTTRFKAKYLDLPDSNHRIGEALIRLAEEDKIETIGKTGMSRTYRWLGDIPEPEPEEANR